MHHLVTGCDFFVAYEQSSYHQHDVVGLIVSALESRRHVVTNANICVRFFSLEKKNDRIEAMCRIVSICA